MQAKTSKKFISKDILFYLPAKLMEGIVGLLTIKIYTTLFTPDIYGDYGILNPTVTVTFLILLGWLLHGLYRYVNLYSEKKQLSELYTTGLFSFLQGALLVFLFVMGLALWGKTGYSNGIIYSAYYLFVAYGLAQIMLNQLVARRRIKMNIILSVGSAIGKLVLTAVLAYVYKKGVISILLSHATIDATVAILIMIRLKIYQHISIKKYSKSTLKTMLNYGYPLIGLSLTMFVLNQSDRYIINYYSGESAAGIYFANYSLASAIYMMMIVGIMRAVYPNLLMAWQQKDKKKSQELLSGGVRYYLLLCVPATIGLIMLAKPISYLILDIDYHGYSIIIAYTSIGMLCYGLVEYCNKAWELTAKTKSILINSLISGILNILLNLICVPRYGFVSAAATTMISFFVYLLLSYLGARKIIIWHIKPITWIRIIGSSIVFGAIIWAIGNYLTFTVPVLIITIILSILIYFSLLLLTGELKEEMKMLRKLRR